MTWLLQSVRLLMVVVLLLVGGPLSAAEVVVVDTQTPMTYLVNSSDPGIGFDWTGAVYDPDPPWAVGSYGVGYETDPPGSGAHDLIETPVSDPANSIYTRTTFQITDVTSVFSLFLGADYDDGFAAWINGSEVYRSPEVRDKDLSWNGGSNPHESSNGPAPDPSPMRDITQAGLSLLQNGTNVLAIGVWNSGLEDLVLAPRLSYNRLLTRAPYLQQGTPDGVIVRWKTGTDTEGRLLYGTAPGSLTTELLGPSGTEHEIEIGGLSPNTRYYYAVGSSTEILAGDDAGHFFDTPPAAGTPKPTRIWVLGDSGLGSEPAARVRDSYYTFTGSRHTELWLMLGDNAYLDGTQQDYQDNLFDIYPGMLAKSVLWPTIGNHDLADGADWPYYDIFTMPTAAEAGGIESSTESYYSFDYANVHFVVLDSNDADRVPPSDMLDWLEADLAGTTQDWIIAYWHHPPYSKGSHDSDDPGDSNGRLVEMRTYAVEILEDYGVDLALSGHSHSYERSYLIDGHYLDSSTFDESMKVDPGDGDINGPEGAYQKNPRGTVPYGPLPGDGAVYTVAGCSSLISNGAAIDLGGTEPNHPAMVRSILAFGSVILDVDGNRLDATFLDDTGQVLDQYTIFKGTPPVAPVANFAATPLTSLAPLTVDFTDLSQNGPTVWSWDFEADGVADSAQPNPSHEYTAVGHYSVELAVSNSAGSDEKLKQSLICVTAGVPDEVTGLLFDTDPTRVVWNQESKATAYDVVRGDLVTFQNLTCLEHDDDDLEASDTDEPDPGQGYFYLARATNCIDQQGTYDTTSAGQPASRDPALVGVCDDCTADTDGDGICDKDDNCPFVSNAGQEDGDGDGTGDACDGCPNDPNKIDPGVCGCDIPDTDTDNDGTPDCDDLCPNDPNKIDPGVCGCDIPDTDTDNDGTPDCDDLCPNDPNKIDPGVCGCDIPDTDTDNDGTPDCDDLCPNDPNKIDPGVCGCDIPDTDTDNDGTPDCDDLCPNDPNKIDPGVCGCDIPDTDTDNDGTPDCDDLCPNDPNKIDPGVCGCDIPDTDTDNDGTPDCDDLCPNDPNKIDPGVCGCDIPDTDTDNDGTPDCDDLCPNDPNKIDPGVCGCDIPDTDTDNDGTPDCDDLCPNDPNKIDPGICGCGTAETTTDIDGDGILDCIDNCRGIPNPNQEDFDDDGIGDPCDCSPIHVDTFSIPAAPPAGWTELNGSWAATTGSLKVIDGTDDALIYYSGREVCDLDQWVRVKMPKVGRENGAVFRQTLIGNQGNRYVVTYDKNDFKFNWYSCSGPDVDCELIQQSVQQYFVFNSYTLGFQLVGTGNSTEVRVWINPGAGDPEDWGTPEWIGTANPENDQLAESGLTIGLFTEKSFGTQAGSFDDFRGGSNQN